MISDERHHQRLRTLEYAHREAWYIGDKADACSPESIKDVQAWADELFTTNEVLRRVDTRVIVRPGFFDPHEHYLYRAIRDQAAWELWEDMTPAERAADVERHRAAFGTLRIIIDEPEPGPSASWVERIPEHVAVQLRHGDANAILRGIVHVELSPSLRRIAATITPTMDEYEIPRESLDDWPQALRDAINSSEGEVRETLRLHYLGMARNIRTALNQAR